MGAPRRGGRHPRRVGAAGDGRLARLLGFPWLGGADNLRKPMGQQYNKVIKRRRRRAYLERVKARIKSARTSKKKAGKK